MIEIAETRNKKENFSKVFFLSTVELSLWTRISDLQLVLLLEIEFDKGGHFDWMNVLEVLAFEDSVANSHKEIYCCIDFPKRKGFDSVLYGRFVLVVLELYEFEVPSVLIQASLLRFFSLSDLSCQELQGIYYQWSVFFILKAVCSDSEKNYRIGLFEKRRIFCWLRELCLVFEPFVFFILVRLLTWREKFCCWDSGRQVRVGLFRFWWQKCKKKFWRSLNSKNVKIEEWLLIVRFAYTGRPNFIVWNYTQRIFVEKHFTG